MQQKKKILTTDAFLSLRVANQEFVNKIIEQLWQTIENFEQKFSRFLFSSELSYLNKNAGHKIAISSELAAFLKTCLEMNRESMGLFNPLILPSLQKAGYLGSWPEVENIDPEIDFSSRIIGKIEDIKLGEDWITLPQNCAIDSGGIGKGYLLDQLSDLILKNGIKDYWLSLGGDLICNGNDENKIGWKVGVDSANEKEKTVDYISTNGKKVAIATSGVTKRKGIYNKKQWHHIIDPRNGLPAQSDILTATVAAKNATLADVFAKSIIILGSTKAKDFIKKKKNTMVILQTTQSSQPLKIYGEKND